MTAKEKAKEIYFAMLNAGNGMTSEVLAKKCAHVVIDQMWQEFDKKNNKRSLYWSTVSEEIEKL